MSVPTSCSAGASFIFDSCDAGFTLLLVVSRHTGVYGSAHQLLEERCDLWRPPVHRGNLEPAGVVEAQETMSDAPAASPAILLAMTAVTGVVDAVSFLAMGHVFTANMTGNIVLLGFALAGAAGLSVSRSSVALIAFLAGAVGAG